MEDYGRQTGTSVQKRRRLGQLLQISQRQGGMALDPVSCNTNDEEGGDISVIANSGIQAGCALILGKREWRFWREKT